MTSLPVVVLVHGAWSTPFGYQTYIDALRRQGFQVHCPRLPTCSDESPPTASLADDIACIEEVVRGLVEAGDRVLMILHSYGGVVGSSAVDGLSLTERKAAGHPGGVVHLLYVCGYILDVGTCVWNILEEAKFDHLWDQFIDTDANGLTLIKDPNLLLFSGRAEQEIVDRALQSLVRFPKPVLHTTVTAAAWKTIPTTYISTLEDYAVPLVYQEIMLKKVRKQGVELKVETYDADHSLYITKEKEMVDAAVKAATDERNA
ncbi:hypothetical protein N7492_009562 [Penicillium capsulatum]|uniref:AB hydrolase-1 domain-containing protein n=1 Tax=Penicillium capsulatum TaxID=69766 RepID=A0A9W9HUR9_9EURO|nr:hypothetical protein N7492_009562 [Penicillium capsulatum]KAJ6106950.1 hypothetical protein N7512_010467 [Penicillium capsulatum]